MYIAPRKPSYTLCATTEKKCVIREWMAEEVFCDALILSIIFFSVSSSLALLLTLSTYIWHLGIFSVHFISSISRWLPLLNNNVCTWNIILIRWMTWKFFIFTLCFFSWNFTLNKCDIHILAAIDHFIDKFGLKKLMWFIFTRAVLIPLEWFAAVFILHKWINSFFSFHFLRECEWFWVCVDEFCKKIDEIYLFSTKNASKLTQYMNFMWL